MQDDGAEVLDVLSRFRGEEKECKFIIVTGKTLTLSGVTQSFC